METLIVSAGRATAARRFLNWPTAKVSTRSPSGIIWMTLSKRSFLNQFYRGEIGAMKPKQELFGGEITIIRPLAYTREEAMVRLAQELGIAGMGQSKCANDDTSHRMLIKRCCASSSRKTPRSVANIFHSLQNVKADYLIETVQSPSHNAILRQAQDPSRRNPERSRGTKSPGL